MFSSVSRRISSAVVRRWTAGLAGFVNCDAMIEPGRESRIRSASSTAAVTPPLGSVRTSSAPKARIRMRRSTLIEDGMTITTLYPRAAPTIAKATPVLPEVASIMVPPGLSCPEASAASTIERAIRSLTEEAGLKASTFATISAPPLFKRLMRTRGVPPMRSVTSVAMFVMISPQMAVSLTHTATLKPTELFLDFYVTLSQFTEGILPRAEISQKRSGGFELIRRHC